MAPYEEKATISRSRIEVKLPPPYLLLPWPDPPVHGYYAWKITFGDDSAGTIVFRTDSAIAARQARDVVRAATLYRCPLRDTAVLDCTVRIQGSARIGSGLVVLEITEPTFVSRVREKKPAVLLRQMYEPGGRLRVDHIGTTFR